MKKQPILSLSILMLCSIYWIVLWCMPSLVMASGWFAAGKYLASVYGIVALISLLCSISPLPAISARWICTICRYLAVLILIFYTILTLDTFVFHAMSWYPGILRYALFSAYGILYSAWSVIGVLWYIGFQEVRQ